MRTVRSLVWLLIVVVGALVVCGFVLRWLMPAPVPPVWAEEYDVTAQPPEAIAPGSVVERTPPAGWSHLVIKSLPRVKASEVPRVPTPLGLPLGRDAVVRQVSWMFTVFTADVVQERQASHARYRLRAIGLGLGANVNGRDTVLTVETAEQLGEKLDPIKIRTLETGYRLQQQSRVVVHGPSFALVDTPVTFRCGEKNRMTRFRYALIVDPTTGRLDVLSWRIGAEGGECADLSRAVLLAPNTVDEAELLVDLSGFNAGIPTELAFGVDDLPPHRLEVMIPAELGALAGKTRFTTEEAHALEAGLRKLLPGG
jgi:hypothetical protein